MILRLQLKSIRQNQIPVTGSTNVIILIRRFKQIFGLFFRQRRKRLQLDIACDRIFVVFPSICRVKNNLEPVILFRCFLLYKLCIGIRIAVKSADYFFRINIIEQLSSTRYDRIAFTEGFLGRLLQLRILRNFHLEIFFCFTRLVGRLRLLIGVLRILLRSLRFLIGILRVLFRILLSIGISFRRFSGGIVGGLIRRRLSALIRRFILFVIRRSCRGILDNLLHLYIIELRLLCDNHFFLHRFFRIFFRI